jgi:hypothetical protein
VNASAEKQNKNAVSCFDALHPNVGIAEEQSTLSPVAESVIVNPNMFASPWKMSIC